MLELLAVGGGGFLAVSMVADVLRDGGPAGMLDAITDRLRRHDPPVQVVASRDAPEISEWLRQHAGTTDLTPADVDLFERQLALIYRDEEAGR